MTLIHISMSGPWELRQNYCPFCDELMDGIYREAYGGYVNDWACEFCGTWICSGEYNPNISQSERRRNVALVERVQRDLRETESNGGG